MYSVLSLINGKIIEKIILQRIRLRIFSGSFFIYIYILTLRKNKGKKRIKNEPTSLNPGNIQPQGVPHHAGSFIALNCAFRD